MRAIQLQATGSIDQIQLRDLPDPVAGPGEAVVRLHAAGLNHRDVWIRQNQYARIRLPCVLGSDGAGQVTAVGAGVDAGWVGQRVVIEPCEGWGDDERAQGKEFLILGMPRQGTFAEQIAVPAALLAPLPEHLSYAEGAALPVAGLTAYRSLVPRGQLQAGEDVLITGIGGGVATLALVLARALGARVAVTSGSQDKLDRAIALGAEAGVLYSEKGWDKALLARMGRAPSLIVDGAGGEDLNTLINLARPGARIVLYGATRGLCRDLDLRRIFFKQLDLRGATMGSPRDFRDLLALVAREKLRPVIDRVLPLSQAAEADRLLEESKQTGKIILDCTR